MLLNHRYEKKEKLGSGTFAVVYKSIDHKQIEPQPLLQEDKKESKPASSKEEVKVQPRYVALKQLIRKDVRKINYLN